MRRAHWKKSLAAVTRKWSGGASLAVSAQPSLIGHVGVEGGYGVGRAGHLRGVIKKLSVKSLSPDGLSAQILKASLEALGEQLFQKTWTPTWILKLRDACQCVCVWNTIKKEWNIKSTAPITVPDCCNCVLSIKTREAILDASA